MSEITGSLVSKFENASIRIQAVLEPSGAIRSRFKQFEIGIMNEFGKLESQSFEPSDGSAAQEVCPYCHEYIWQGECMNKECNWKERVG